MIPPFELFGKTFGIYPLCALAGIFACGLFACVQAKKRGLDVDDMIVALLLCAVGALVGGHILYGITNLPLLGQVLARVPETGLSGDFWSGMLLVFGGSVFYGGLLGGMAAAVFTGKRRSCRQAMWT